MDHPLEPWTDREWVNLLRLTPPASREQQFRFGAALLQLLMPAEPRRAAAAFQGAARNVSRRGLTECLRSGTLRTLDTEVRACLAPEDPVRTAVNRIMLAGHDPTSTVAAVVGSAPVLALVVEHLWGVPGDPAKLVATALRSGAAIEPLLAVADTLSYTDDPVSHTVIIDVADQLWTTRARGRFDQLPLRRYAAAIASSGLTQAQLEIARQLVLDDTDMPPDSLIATARSLA